MIRFSPFIFKNYMSTKHLIGRHMVATNQGSMLDMIKILFVIAAANKNDLNKSRSKKLYHDCSKMFIKASYVQKSKCYNWLYLT